MAPFGEPSGSSEISMPKFLNKIFGYYRKRMRSDLVVYIKITSLNSVLPDINRASYKNIKPFILYTYIDLYNANI